MLVDLSCWWIDLSNNANFYGSRWYTASECLKNVLWAQPISTKVVNLQKFEFKNFSAIPLPSKLKLSINDDSSINYWWIGKQVSINLEIYLEQVFLNPVKILTRFIIPCKHCGTTIGHKPFPLVFIYQTWLHFAS